MLVCSGNHAAGRSGVRVSFAACRLYVDGGEKAVLWLLIMRV